VGTSAVAQIAEAQRAANARRATASVAALTTLALLDCVLLRAPFGYDVLVGASAITQAGAYWLARRGRSTAAMAILCASVFVEQVGAVAIERQLGPLPYITSIVLLLLAATSRARLLPIGFAASLLALAIEAWLSPWARADQITVTTAALFLAVVFVVSLLHVHGTERAFAIAEQQDRARESAATAAVESERRYRLIADSTDDLIALVDAEGNALYLSPSHERVLGIPVRTAIGRPVTDWLDVENRKAAADAFRRALAHGEAVLEVVVRRPDGKRRILDTNMKRVEAEQGRLVAILSRDATEQRELQMRLHASERMEALGRLAGSVAHDFNNLLTVIQGAADIARRTLPADHRAQQDLDAIQDAVGASAGLARQLLTFSRKQVAVRSRIDVGEALGAQRDILARLVGPEVHVEYAIEANLPAVFMALGHLEQIAINLAANARDATPAGGRLRFVLRQRVLADREVADLVAGTYVEMQAIDDGAGIAKEALPHIFEPLFSTKGPNGTGLGLATCLSIVTQAGGAIDVESEAGKGTTFRVLLPAADGSVPKASVNGARTRVKRVLVVDDDAAVLSLTTRMLRADGHEVVTASTAAEARSILSDATTRLDAMVTDIVLREERGTELLGPCRQAWPQARIVVVSGYAPDPGASETVSAHGAKFLAKPFGRDQLLQAMRGD
jgi:PAS domain S-box-containing protein